MLALSSVRLHVEPHSGGAEDHNPGLNTVI